MESNTLFPRISRRQLLKTGSALAGAAAATGVLANGRVRQLLALDRPLRVGLLAPSSSLYPQLGQSLAAGLQLFFNQHSDHMVEPVSKTIGFGPALAGRQARELLDKERAEVVVGVMSAHVAAEVSDIFVSGRTPLIVSTVGAHVPRPEDWNPFTLYNSLNYWQANLAMGEWAARNLGRTVFVTGSLYESGYDSFNAFQVGFARAGGRVVGKRVTHTQSKDSGLPRLFEEIERVQPNLVFGAYSGREALEFVQAYAASGLDGRIPLAASAFAVDDSLLTELGNAAAGIWSCFSWSGALDNQVSQVFVDDFWNEIGRLADPFALLGYDAGRLVARLAEATGGAMHRADQLRMAGELLSGPSPRGELIMGNSNLMVSPLYVRQVQEQNGRWANAVVERLPVVSPPPAEQMRVKSGWLNPYLCA